CREPPVCSFAKQAAGIDCFFSRNSKGCGAEFHSTTECPPFPGRLKAVVALFPIAYPGEICPPEKIYDQQLLRGIAGANEGDLEGGIQQLRGVAPESAVRRGAQVSGALLLSRGMGPSELGIWLEKDSLAVAGWANLGLDCRHIKESYATFQERWAKGHMLVPADRAVIAAQIHRSLLAIDDGLAALNRYLSTELNLRMLQNLSVVQRGPRSLIPIQPSPMAGGSFPVRGKSGCGLFF